eukprot:scaffold323100_cov41-Prasinocladus_malaysianus.AAC.1
MPTISLSSRVAQHTRGGEGRQRWQPAGRNHQPNARQATGRRQTVGPACSHRERRPFAKPEPTLTG